MARTRDYFQTAMSFRESLKAINADHKKKLDRLEAYKGSRGYNDDVAKAEKERKEKIAALQSEYRTKFDSILRGMRETALSRPMAAPSQEQLNLLSALRMRKKVSSDELRQAARTLESSPLALSVLDDIAHDQGHLGMTFGRETTETIVKHIDSLRTSAGRICRMEKTDDRVDMARRASVFQPDHDDQAIELFRVDRDFSCAEDCLAYLGGVTDYKSFSEAVD